VQIVVSAWLAVRFQHLAGQSKRKERERKEGVKREGEKRGGREGK
jgi:hypothetical protein